MDVAWTIPALADLDHIQDFIARDNPVAAFRRTSDILRRADAVPRANPAIGRHGRVAGTREWIVPGTAYLVAYRVRSRIEILAVVHRAREWPEGFWTDGEGRCLIPGVTTILSHRRVSVPLGTAPIRNRQIGAMLGSIAPCACLQILSRVDPKFCKDDVGITKSVSKFIYRRFVD